MKKIICPMLLMLAALAVHAQDIEPMTDAGGRFYFADETGTRLSQSYTAVKYLEDRNLWLVAAGGWHEGSRIVKCKWGIADARGREILAPKYDFIGPIDADGNFWVNKGGKDLDDVKSVQKIITQHMNTYSQKEKDPEKLYAERLRVEEQYTKGKVDIHGVKVSGGKFGYANVAGTVILQPKYADLANSFSDGRAWVVKGTKYGVVSPSGEMTVPFQYSYVGDFCEGLAVVSTRQRAAYYKGYIDTVGNVVTPLVFTEAGELSGGFASVTGIPYNIPDECYSAALLDSLSGKVTKGTVVKKGFVGPDGKLITEMKYDRVYLPCDGLAACYAGDYGTYVDNCGHELVPMILGKAYDFEDGRAVVSLPLQAMFANGKGKRITAPSNMVTASSDDCLFGMIDTDGVALTDFVYKRIFAASDSTRLFKSKDDMFGWLDLDGNSVMDKEFVWAGAFNYGVAPVKENGKYGYIRKSGEMCIPCIYDDIETSFSDGIVAVCTGSRWGAIDMSGNEAIPFIAGSIEDVQALREKVYVKNGCIPLGQRDVEIWLIRKANDAEHFGIGSVIPESNWDF